MVRNLPKACDICFKTMGGDYLKRHMLRHEKERKSESYINKIKIGEKNLAKSCEFFFFKTMKGYNLKRHIM